MVIKNIIFSGGGLKGWAYIGTLQALEEYKNIFETEHIIGVSIGSIFGLFFLLGLKYDFILDFIMELDFLSLVDIDVNNILDNQSIEASLKAQIYTL